ncbi:hypothetical protein F4802DRAFT_81179 [Xylaria palmicola]|nr:hypothetical protein F4802DRAFT_81179 [Xylaria palmicola]
MEGFQTWNWDKLDGPSVVPDPEPSTQVTEVYDHMRGFLKSTHWSKPYYSALVHNNPQLPYHLLEHVNCTYLSTHGRPPTLLALKQHAQSLAVLISMLAPARMGGTLGPPDEGKSNGDEQFAAHQAFDWLNDLQTHYNTDDGSHKKPLNALLNLVKSNSDTTGPKWHCPLDTVEIEFPEKHPFQQYRPYETHMTLLMHANEILERLDHEYSAMGGILGIIPLDSEKVDEQRALAQAKTTLVGQWILYTQHLVVRMHELEIAYGNSLDLLANEAIVPMQHISIHGPDGRSGREIVFPQDRWILANAGEDVFTFIHQMLDRAEAHQEAQDDVFAQQNVLGDAAYSSNEDLKYRGIVKVDLNTRFYRLRSSGHGPLFVLPAFGDRPGTRHTRDMENRPTVIAVPQPSSKEAINSWESKHKDVEVKLLKLTVDKSNLEAKVSQLNSSVEIRDREIDRLNEVHKQYDKIEKGDKDLTKQIVHLQENVRYFQKMVRETEEREMALKQDIENFKQANITAQGTNDPVNSLVDKINDQQSEVRDLRKEIEERDKKIEDLARDNDTLRILHTSPFSTSSGASPEQVSQLRAQLATAQQERQMLQQEIYKLKKSKVTRGKILNFSEGLTLDYGSIFEDSNQGISACSFVYLKTLLAAENERNNLRQKLDNGGLETHGIQAELNECKGQVERLQDEIEEMSSKSYAPKPSKIINLPWELQYTSTFRDDNQGLIVLRTDWYDDLIKTEKSINNYEKRIVALQTQVKEITAPIEADLSTLFDAVQEQMTGSGTYIDTNRHIAVLALNYYNDLAKAEQMRNANQEELDECRKAGQALEQHLTEARTQLQQYQEAESKTQIAAIQDKMTELQNQLNTSLEDCAALEEQVRALTVDDTASELRSRMAELRLKENEITKVRTRYNALQLNEINLRREVRYLRTKMTNMTIRATPKAGRGGEADNTDEELKQCRAELESLQMVWDELQIRHVQLQSDHHDAEQKCDEDKLRIQLQRDELREKVKTLEQQLETLIASEGEPVEEL